MDVHTLGTFHERDACDEHDVEAGVSAKEFDGGLSEHSEALAAPVNGVSSRFTNKQKNGLTLPATLGIRAGRVLLAGHGTHGGPFRAPEGALGQALLDKLRLHGSRDHERL